MPGLHDFTNYLKRGYGRATFHASLDVRTGLLSRSDAMLLAEKYDQIEPQVLEYYLEITGMNKDEFYEIIKSKREEAIKNKQIPVKNVTHNIHKKPFILEFIDEIQSQE